MDYSPTNAHIRSSLFDWWWGEGGGGGSPADEMLHTQLSTLTFFQCKFKDLNYDEKIPLALLFNTIVCSVLSNDYTSIKCAFHLDLFLFVKSFFKFVK